jgi:hypothetical protein
MHVYLSLFLLLGLDIAKFFHMHIGMITSSR